MSAGTLYIAVKGDTKELVTALKSAQSMSVKFGKDTKAAVDQSSKSLDFLKRNVLALGSAWVGLNGIKSIIQIADQYSLLDSKLKLVSKDSQEFGRVYQELFNISQNTGSSFANNASNYSNLALALKDTNITSRESLEIFDLVNKSLVVAGASTAEASSFMLQFRQALGSGVLQGEEFKAMMESNSYFGSQLAKALDTDIKGLREMSREGKLTTDTLRKAFPEMAATIEKDFGGIQKTISRSMAELQNAFNDVVADANKTTGGTNSVAASVSDLAKSITENKETISAIFVGMIDGAKWAGESILTVTRYIQGLAIVAASQDKDMWDWLTAKPGDMKTWLSEAASGVAQLKDQLKVVSDEITQISKVRMFEQENGGWTAEAENHFQALITQQKSLASEIENTGKVEASVAKETDKAGESTIKTNEKIIVSEKEKTAKVIKLRTDERYQVLEMQKEKLRASEENQRNVDLEIQLMNSLVAAKQTTTDTFIVLEQLRAKGTRETLEDISGSTRLELTAMEGMWVDFAHSSRSAFSDFFASGLKGEFDSIGEAWRSLCGSMVDAFIDAVAEMAAKQLTTSLFGTSATGSRADSESGDSGWLGTAWDTVVDWWESSDWATGGYIGSHPLGGMISAGSGVKDDVFLGMTGSTANFGMGGEFIVNKKATASHRQELEAINAEGFAGGGVVGASRGRVFTRFEELVIAMQEAGVQTSATTASMYEMASSIDAANEASGERTDAVAAATETTTKNREETVKSTEATEKESKAKEDSKAKSFDLTDSLIDLGVSLIDVTTDAMAAGLGLGFVGPKTKDFALEVTGLSSALGTAVQATKGYINDIQAALGFAQAAAAEAASYNDKGFEHYSPGDVYGESTDPEGYYDGGGGGYGGSGVGSGTDDGTATGFGGDQGGESSKYADGGYHSGGWRIVGERGPELEYTPPSQIFSNSDSKKMFSDASRQSSQSINLTIPVSVGNEPLTTLMVKIADNVATVRQRQGVTGRAYI